MMSLKEYARVLLERRAEIEPRFDMHRYWSCDDCGCLIGWYNHLNGCFPFTGLVYWDELRSKLSNENYVLDVFLFGYGWHKKDNSLEGAIKRILFSLWKPESVVSFDLEYQQYTLEELIEWSQLYDDV